MFDYFYSDPHVGHKNIIGYCNRPFSSIAEHDAELVKRYNAKVSPGQTVLWVGDAFFCAPNRAKDIMQCLNGNKVLVQGNHDKSPTRMLEIGFSWVVPAQLILQIKGVTCIVCHYPPANSTERYDERYLDRRPKPAKGELVIHGHSHEKTKRVDNRIHVGVDAWDYAPVSWAEVEALV